MFILLGLVSIQPCSPHVASLKLSTLTELHPSLITLYEGAATMQ
jgi:hypothetical protein